MASESGAGLRQVSEETNMKRFIILAALTLAMVTGTIAVTSLVGAPQAVAEPCGSSNC